MKKIFYFLIITIFIALICSINIFLVLNSDLNHLIGFNINLFLYFLIVIICIFISNKNFKKANLKTSKNFLKDIKNSFANSFFSTSIISIILVFLIYGFLRNVLEFINLQEGIINYCIYASKIWFISSPFIGLEVTIFRYYYEIECYSIPMKILIYKSFIYLFISLLFYSSKQINCFIYAKPICDIIFLIFYSKICFSLTLKIS